MALSRSMLLVMVAQLFGRSFACTAIGVGKDASASGAPMIGHSEDSGPAPNDVRLSRVPAKSWPAGSLRPLYNWHATYPRVVDSTLSPEYSPVGDQQPSIPLAHIPQVAHTFGYWDTDYGVQNEKGVSMGESTCTAKTVGWPADKPYGFNRAGIEDISKIAMERCATARCAVQTMGDIAVEHGFYSADSGLPAAPGYGGSSECLMVGDVGEIWIFNIMTGRGNASSIWAAQRTPSDHVVAIGNSFTIRKMNLSDHDNFLYSPGVSDLAEEMGWWSRKEETSPQVFDFFKAYGYTPSEDPQYPGGPAVAAVMDSTLAYYSSRRMWRIFSLLSPLEGAKLDESKGNLPKTVDPLPASVAAPRGSVTLSMVQNTYRDHYEGTQYDLTKGMAAGPYGNPNRGGRIPVGSDGVAAVLGQWERAISMHRTSWSFVLEARPNGRSITWFGWDAPHGTAYLPFYAAATSGAPRSYSGSHHMAKFSTDCAWWAFNLVNQYQDLNFAVISKEVLEKAKGIDAQGQRSVAVWESDADKLAPKDALDLLTAKSNAFADQQVTEWWEFAWTLIAKYRGYVVTYNETDTGEDIFGQQYSSWWLKSPEIGFTTWSSSGPFHGIVLDVSEPGTSMEALPPVAVAQSNVSFSLAVALVLFPISMGIVGVIAHKIGLRQGRNECASGGYYVAQP